jgi:hypothetical protein
MLSDYKSWLKEVRTALKDKAQTAKNNLPTTVINRGIKKENLPIRIKNQEIEEANEERKRVGLKNLKKLPTKPLEKLPFKIGQRSRSVLNVESGKKRSLRKRSPKAWRNAVDAITDPDVRTRAACLIWWDWFGDRRGGKPWHHLDKFLHREYVEIDDKVLANALVQCGYTPWMAHNRTLVKGGE